MQYPEITTAIQDAYGKNFRLGKSEVAPQSNDRSARPDETKAENRIDAGQALLKIVEPMERIMSSVGVDVSFSIDEATKKVQAEVRTADGERVIRKVPSDEILQLAASIRELTESFDNFVTKTL